MNKKEIEAYKAGFLNGIDAKNNYKISIFGYDLAKLIDIIGEYEMQHEKKKMTRKEAIACFQKHTAIYEAENVIDFYIEVGMLKIVEETPLAVMNITNNLTV